VTLEPHREETEEPEEERREVRMEFRMARVESGGGGGISSLSITGGGPQHVQSDEQGRYEIRYIKDGNYAVIASGAGYSREELSPVTVREGRESAGVDLKLMRGYSVSGVLLDSATGMKVAFCPIALTALEDGKPGEDSTALASGEDGAFAFADLRPGDYRLTVMSEDYSGARDITIRNENLEDLEFRVKRN
jgi:hypothetical protein